ncbi:molecular chaperone [Citrobacter sedlakii]|uniref:fimbrial biogenesis chaperone n=1 Tax=Citrobacter TaxID=544 RepID=UPI001F1DE98B|nr:fimbria/pilus periplasmic chaperone [Citrobacter sedlakii]MCK8144412.1 fimbria/pilus periplasmic chaperone [Citrobacter sedlakii]
MRSYSLPSPKMRVFQYAMLSIALLSAGGFINAADAAGVALNGTRIIYPQGAREITVSTKNTDNKTAYLVQSWASDEHGEKTSSFIVTPPLFVLKSGATNMLRITYTGSTLPEDKESVFYFNSKAIPSVDKKALAGNTLQIATQTVVKLFYRPAHLTVKSTDVPEMLRCQQNHDAITVTNPSPYYATLVNFTVGGKKLPNTMVAPKASETINFSAEASGPIVYQTLNDYGALTPKQTCKA